MIESYSPLEICGVGWSVEFQRRPDSKVIVTGKKPEFSEFYSLIKSVPYDDLIIESLYVATCVAFDSQKIEGVG